MELLHYHARQERVPPGLIAMRPTHSSLIRSAIPQQNPVLSRSLSRFEASPILRPLVAGFARPTAAQRNGRSGFSYLSTVAAVAVLLLSVIVLGACGGSGSSTKSVAPVITTNPMSVTVTAGAAATFTAAASGQPAPTVQWQVSSSGGPFTNLAGATSPTLGFATTTAAMNGNQYLAVFTNASGSATTMTATLTVNTAPAITTNPANVTVAAGATATFTAAASGTPTPTVQWQVSSNGGAFANVSGATSTTLSLTGTTVAMSGNKYQAVFTNTAGTATTSAATLTVTGGNTAPAITTKPANVTVAAGATATFTAAASGTPTPTVQWQVSSNGGAFANVSGATSTTLSLTGTTVAMSGNKYQAVFTNAAGTATTSAATLTVTGGNTAPTITTNPANVTVAAGATATFTAAASGTPTPTVQWQVSSNGGAFSNVSGATSTTLSLTGTTVAMSGNEYQAVFTNAAGSATTAAALLTVNAASAAPTITTNPANVTVTAGATATFTAAATGTPTPTVQWQVSSSGGAFSNVSGATSTTLSLTGTTVAMSGNKYQAVFTNAAGSATTTAATLTVTAASAISGTVKGGLVPISGSTIQLYAVGTASDGSASTPLLTGTPVLTDGSGNFTLPSFTCPTPESLVYITATGGNPGLAAGTDNTAITLMSALGACSTVTSAKPIVINELTTVASVFALETYMTSPTAIGSSAADAADLANDFASVDKLVDTTTGTTPGPALPANESVTVPTLNTLADILAPCVQTAGGVAGDSSACGDLFAAATPPAPPSPAAQPANSRAPQAFLTRTRADKSAAQPDTAAPTAPTNTASATQDMAANPSNNVSTLSGIASPTGPYQPQQSSVPSSWNVIIVPGLGAGESANFLASSLPAGVGAPVGQTSVFFTTVLNLSSASQTLTGSPTALGLVPVTLLACPTDPTTNLCLSAPSSSFSVTIPPAVSVDAPGTATFATFVTATAAIPYNAVNNVVYLTFTDSHGTIQVVGFANVNTETDVNSFQVLAATGSGDGVLTIPFSTQGAGAAGAFAVEAANVGNPIGGGVVVSAEAGTLPVGITICQTDPTNGACLATPGSTVTLASFPRGTSVTFSVFVIATAAIASDPANNRIYVQFRDGGGNLLTFTSVAVVTD